VLAQVRGTPTLFIDGVVHLGGGYDAATLTEALAGKRELLMMPGVKPTSRKEQS
jgi:hypothetical protein